jgi:hypothetical protein
MVKCCAYDGCDRTIGDRFEYCYTHYATVKGIPITPFGTGPKPTIPPPPSGAVTNPRTGNTFGGKPWHDDPIVDVLLKINSNLGRIAKVLEEDAARGDDETEPAGSDAPTSEEADDTPVIVDTFP